MREYPFQASDETVESLRRLRGAWASYTATERAVQVALTDGSEVRVKVGAADVEGVFDAFRIDAFIVGEHEFSDEDAEEDALDVEVLANAPIEPAGDFAAGSNDVVLFTGVTWSEAGASVAPAKNGNGATGGSMHLSGHPGQLSETAEIVCITTDATVIATTAGSGMLLRTGLKPGTIELVTDAIAIAKFLLERGYQSA